jgi:hypothetical protein
MAPLVTCTISYPRIGPKCELKTALERHWAGAASAAELKAAAAAVEDAAWRAQAAAGVDLIGLDGTLYDHVADAWALGLGLAPPRFARFAKTRSRATLRSRAARRASPRQTCPSSSTQTITTSCLSSPPTRRPRPTGRTSSTARGAGRRPSAPRARYRWSLARSRLSRSRAASLTVRLWSRASRPRTPTSSRSWQSSASRRSR